MALSTASARGGTTTRQLDDAHPGRCIRRFCHSRRAHEDLDGLGDLVEQGLDLGGIIDVTLGQDGSDNPAGHRVKADVQLAPRAPLAGTVLLDQPLARATQLQAGTVDQQVDRAAGGMGLRRQL